MTELDIDGMKFKFPLSWNASKHDEWLYYRNHYSKTADGVKAVDIIAVHRKILWLIEVKDYRLHRRTKAIQIHSEFALKVVFTLSSLLPARINATRAVEQDAAKEALACDSIRLVLHIEQPTTHSKLFPRAIDPSKVHQKMKSALKAIDPHPLVVESSSMGTLQWSVS